VGLILDTSVLIAAERGGLRLTALLESLEHEPVGMAAITASELLHGCHRATEPGVRARRAAFVESLLDLVPVRPFGLPEARSHAHLWVELSREGEMIGPHDLLIAATALARGDRLVTLNRREFGRAPGLRLVEVER
jgi:tRNA(fMet)-specific endonuclease VapC